MSHSLYDIYVIAVVKGLIDYIYKLKLNHLNEPIQKCNYLNCDVGVHFLDTECLQYRFNKFNKIRMKRLR